jgi:hypothetical protein
MTAPDNVKSLGQRFEGNGEAYRSGNYNAAQLRNGFLNWFLEALGCLTQFGGVCTRLIQIFNPT